MSFHHTIACPDCSHPIPIESTLLLTGQAFSCANPQCNVSISLAGTDMARVSSAFEQLAELRESALEQSGQDPAHHNGR